MRTRTAISGSELLLGVIAIRLAVLVVVGWGLTLLPRQTHDGERACLSSPVTSSETQAKAIGSRLADATLDDMLLHD